MKSRIYKGLTLIFSIILIMSCIGCGIGSGTRSTDVLMITTDSAAEEGKIEVDFKLQECNTKGVLKVLTNLPVGTVFTVSLIGPNNKYNSTVTTKVISLDGLNYIQTEPFTNKGDALSKGKYRANISMNSPSSQPSDVQKIIGVKGGLLNGINVVVKNSETVASANIIVKVKSGLIVTNS